MAFEADRKPANIAVRWFLYFSGVAFQAVSCEVPWNLCY